MKDRTRRILNYLIDRLGESSTWRGLSLILTALGVVLEPGKMEAVIALGLLASGLIGVIFADKLKREERPFGPSYYPTGLSVDANDQLPVTYQVEGNHERRD